MATHIRIRQSTRYFKHRLVRIRETETVEYRRHESAAVKATREVACRIAIGDSFIVRQFAVSDRNGCRYYATATEGDDNQC
jgi:hypothetical protein